MGAGQRVLAIDKTTGRETSLMIPLAQLVPETPVVFSDNWVAVSDQGGIWAWQSGL